LNNIPRFISDVCLLIEEKHAPHMKKRANNPFSKIATPNCFAQQDSANNKDRIGDS